MTHTKASSEATSIAVPLALVKGMRERVRHDHGYPMEFYTPENPHHCVGCEVEDHLDSLLYAHAEALADAPGRANSEQPAGTRWPEVAGEVMAPFYAAEAAEAAEKPNLTEEL